MASYIGIIHKDADSEFGVSFPDYPGCVTAGRTLNEAGRMAAEAVATPQEHRTVRINLTLHESALRRIDEAARVHRMSRSSYLVQRALGEGGRLVWDCGLPRDA